MCVRKKLLREREIEGGKGESLLLRGLAKTNPQSKGEKIKQDATFDAVCWQSSIQGEDEGGIINDKSKLVNKKNK